MSSDDRGCSRPMESERKGRKEGESDRGVVYRSERKEGGGEREKRGYDFHHEKSQKRKDKSPRNNETPGTPVYYRTENQRSQKEAGLISDSEV